MLDGIDYYPKKRRSKKIPILIFLLMAVIGFAAYWYDQTGMVKNLEKPKKNIIVISEPQAIETPPSSSNVKQSALPTGIIETPSVVENLDEIILIQKPNTQ